MTRPVLILAGGFGTRLRLAVPNVPKPLAPVAGRPFLDHLVESWVAQGARDLVFLLHHQAEKVEDFLEAQRASGRWQGCSMRCVTEPRPLGTGGAVAHGVASLSLEGTFLVTNADTWLDSAFAELLAAPAPAIAVAHVSDVSRYGAVLLGAGMVVGFAEKEQRASSGWINAGVYHLADDMFRSWDGVAFSLEQSLLPAMSKAGRLRAVKMRGNFIDIGIAEDYERFDRWVTNGRGSTL